MTTSRYMLATVPTVLALILFLPRLGERDLGASHEGRAAQNAQRLLDEHNLGVPRLYDGSWELQKPPLDYWLIAAAAWLRGGGVDACAVRLPAALAGFMCVGLVTWHLTSRGRTLAGVLAGGILATAQHFTASARVGRIDMPLTLAVTAAVIFWLTADDGRRAWRFAAAVALAAGLLLKGPLALVLVGVILVSARPWRTLRPVLWVIPMASALAAPWYIVAHYQTAGEFTRVFFWYHNFQRAAGGAEALASHPWYFYGPRWAVDYLPWSVCLPAAGYWVWRSRVKDADARTGLMWELAVTFILTLSNFKRADYLLPAYPGAALWLGCVGERLFRTPYFRAYRRPMVGGFVAVALAVVVGWQWQIAVVEPGMDDGREKRSFAEAVRSAAPRPELVILFRVEDHALTFHLGRPVNTVLEWENLDVWAGRPGVHHVILPAECWEDWPRHVSAGILEEVRRYEDTSDRRRPRSMVLARTRPHSAPPAAESADDHPADAPPRR